MGRWQVMVTATLLALAAQAAAQSYPDKQVRIIIGFPPGSATDYVGRVVAQKLGEIWRQTVRIENRGGGGGSVGSAAVVKARPDGYTLLVNSSSHAVNPAIHARLPYDTARDFTDIAPLAIQPNVLVVTSGSPYKTVTELVDAARERPGSVKWGYPGVGSSTHLTTERFFAAAGLPASQLSFVGTAEVLKALHAGQVQAFWAPASSASAGIREGRLRPLAVSTEKRSAALPDVPTLGQAGGKSIDSALWFGVWGPAKMPATLVEKINADVRKAIADPQVREKLMSAGNDTMDMSPRDFARFVQTEMQAYQHVVRAAGIKPR